MNAILRIEEWGDHHHPMWVDFLRILLGMLLIAKGFFYAMHAHAITNLMLENQMQYLIFMAAQYTILFHIAGGILIAFGLLTRFSSLMNLPTLICAVFFINLPKGMLPFNSELLLSVLVLVLLIFFLILGDGKFSAEHFISVHKDIW